MEEDLHIEEDATAGVKLLCGAWTVEDLLNTNDMAANDKLWCGVWMRTCSSSTILSPTGRATRTRLCAASWVGKCCQLWWLNYFRHDVWQGNMTEQEQLLILELDG
uniref:Uncharacterized protein n=1 Tax=Oryza punctata TaxID=4537 RepID=A0A0E0LKI0_ORYPU